MRITVKHFAFVIPLTAASIAQEYEDAAVRCFDRPIETCLVRLPGPMEPIGGGLRVEQRAATVVASASAANFSTGVAPGDSFDAVITRARR